MTAKVSIIIPTLNCADLLPPLLEQLFEGVAHGLVTEVLFADGGSTDNLQSLADAAGIEVVTTEQGRGAQLSGGADRARGEWYFFLHADSQLPADWIKIVGKKVNQSPDRAAVFKLRFDAQGYFAKQTAFWANLRTKVLQLPYGDQGLIIHSSLYLSVGGYAQIPLMEDVDIAKKLRCRIDLIPAEITTGAEKYIRDGWLKRGALNLSILIRFLLGADPPTLVKSYDPKVQEK